MMMRILILVLTSIILLGCASAPRYTNTLAKNLTINLKLERGEGFFNSGVAVAGINDVAKDCSQSYKGYVELRQGANEIGLTIGQPTLLIVEIGHKGGSYQRGSVITPKPGIRYQIDASYVDEMYDFRLYEISRGGKKTLAIVPTIPGCDS